MTVQARNIYPDLLLARMFFSVGGAAVTTMVTATLPSMTTAGLSQSTGMVDRPCACVSPTSPSTSSDTRVTQLSNSELASNTIQSPSNCMSSQLAGFVGMFAGCGALVALGCFLPLPAQLQKYGIDTRSALSEAYYLIGSTALLIALFCFFGLRGLKSEESKTVRAIWGHSKSRDRTTGEGWLSMGHSRPLVESANLAFRDPEIGLAYLGGFIARSSSVAISLFVPLFVHDYFISAGTCKAGDSSDIKLHCKEAYFLAAKLTGASQLVALICAPIFGFAGRFKRHHVPLCCAAVSGIIGYCVFALTKVPDPSKEDGSLFIFLASSLLGISQIGAIVCSLGLLGQRIHQSESHARYRSNEHDAVAQSPTTLEGDRSAQRNETSPLVGERMSQARNLIDLKGSLAGTYSLLGGAGILILTKLGGFLFDSLSPASPFVMMAIFNAFLLCAILFRSGLQLIGHRQKIV